MRARTRQFSNEHNGAEVSGEVDIDHGDSRTSDTVTIQGRITVQNSGQMRSELANALRKNPAKLSVDLSAVSYIDTSGLATLLEASRIARKQGTRLILSGIHDQPRYIFEITDLDRLFDIAGKEESA